MRSAVETLADSSLGARRSKHKRYVPMCACCAPDASEVRIGKPQRRESARPALAWRTRLTSLEVQAEATEACGFSMKSAFEAVDSAGEAIKLIADEILPC